MFDRFIHLSIRIYKPDSKSAHFVFLGLFPLALKLYLFRLSLVSVLFPLLKNFLNSLWEVLKIIQECADDQSLNFYPYSPRHMIYFGPICTM